MHFDYPPEMDSYYSYFNSWSIDCPSSNFNSSYFPTISTTTTTTAISISTITNSSTTASNILSF